MPTTERNLRNALHMAGYAMVEALRELNIEKVALNGVYLWPSWLQGTVGFLKEAGFDVTHQFGVAGKQES